MCSTELYSGEELNPTSSYNMHAWSGDVIPALWFKQYFISYNDVHSIHMEFTIKRDSETSRSAFLNLSPYIPNL